MNFDFYEKVENDILMINKAIKSIDNCFYKSKFKLKFTYR